MGSDFELSYLMLHGDQIKKIPLVSCDICVVLLNGLQGVVVVTSFDRGPL